MTGLLKKPGIGPWRYLVITFIAVIATVLIFRSHDMSIRQQILQWVYPLLMKSNSRGSRDQVLENKGLVKPAQPVYLNTIELIDGNSLDLSSLKGRKILFVNTASDCGYTAQYASLQELSELYKDKLVVIGFPANDFKEQEKGDDNSIAAFCQKNYGVQFPLAKKSIVIKGGEQNPVFAWLSEKKLNGWCNQAPVWNFSKYLLDEQGNLVSYFPPGISPLDPLITRHFQ